MNHSNYFIYIVYSLISLSLRDFLLVFGISWGSWEGEEGTLADSVYTINVENFQRRNEALRVVV